MENSEAKKLEETTTPTEAVAGDATESTLSGTPKNSAESASPQTAPENNTPSWLSDVSGPTPEAIHEAIIYALKTVYDPEIPVDIYELGLIYKIEVSEEGDVQIHMTLTSPGCPVAGSLLAEVEFKVSYIHGVKGTRIDLVWDPPWTPERMSEAARLTLGM